MTSNLQKAVSLHYTIFLDCKNTLILKHPYFNKVSSRDRIQFPKPPFTNAVSITNMTQEESGLTILREVCWEKSGLENSQFALFLFIPSYILRESISTPC